MSTLHDLEEQLQHLAQGDGLIVALTGANFSGKRNTDLPWFRGILDHLRQAISTNGNGDI